MEPVNTSKDRICTMCGAGFYEDWNNYAHCQKCRSAGYREWMARQRAEVDKLKVVTDRIVAEIVARYNAKGGRHNGLGS